MEPRIRTEWHVIDDSSNIEVVVDGREVRAVVDNDLLLLHFLRETAGASSPKWGCGTGDCGACTVVLDGDPVDSCLVYAVECDGAEVVTATAAAATAIGAIVADELERAGAVQCGICTPGFLTTIVNGIGDLSPQASHDEIALLLSGNVCRCTGYSPIIEAVRSARARIEREVGAP